MLGVAPVPETAEERRRRREQRRAERAAELAEFNAAKIERHNEMLFDDEHFVPSEPPPLPRPKARTIWAIVLLLAGVILMVGPPVLAISGNATLLLGLVPLVGDVADIGLKANLRNLALLERHAAPGVPPSTADYAFVVICLVLLALIAVTPIVLAVWLLARWPIV